MPKHLSNILTRSPRSSPKSVVADDPVHDPTTHQPSQNSDTSGTQASNSLGLALSGGTIPPPVPSGVVPGNAVEIPTEGSKAHDAGLPEDPAAGWYGSPKLRSWPSAGDAPDSGVQASGAKALTSESVPPSAPDQAVAVSRTRDSIRKALGIHHDARTTHKSPKHSPRQKARDVSPAEGKARDAALTVAHDVLDASLDLIRLVPVPGLQEAATSLIRIWDFVQDVDSNRMACLHLAERCASILGSVRTEVETAGPDVWKTLDDPLRKLTATFHEIEEFMEEQARLPFIKRYLRRDEILKTIQESHENLSDNLGAFGLAVQIRILREIKAQQAATQGQPIQRTLSSPPPYSDDLASSTRSLAQSQDSMPSDPLPQIVSHHQERFIQDYRLDAADLKHVIQQALSSGSDAHLIETLQIQRPDIAEAVKTLQRALEDPHLSTPSSRKSSNSSDSRSPVSVEQLMAEHKDDMTIHREFMEEEIEALRNTFSSDIETIPPWTITRWEVDRHKEIGGGYYSKVFKGAWNGRNVAIKVVAHTTPAHLFVHEAEIWNSLKHPHVLELLGASSASSNPPWFFVSPYMKNGNLVTFLQQHPNHGRTLQFIHEVAIGMEYLHGQNVLHGDLKASNVLINDKFQCVITDFGQSKLKSEAYRISGTKMPTQGTLRWLAPEAMDSAGNLTFERDIYAFAICCTEILGNGALPWVNLDDFIVRKLVLELDRRPEIPNSPDASQKMQELIDSSWARNPATRPPFTVIVELTQRLLHDQNRIGQDITPRPGLMELREESRSPSDYHKSPSLEPQPDEELECASPWDDEYPEHESPVSATSASDNPFRSAPTDAEQPSSQSKSKESSVYSGPIEGSHLIAREDAVRDGYVSPAPPDDITAERRDERRYRLTLTHPYHESLKLALWTPSQVFIGDVGYHKRPHGSFVRLFSAFDPDGTSTVHGRHPLPLKPVPTGNLLQDKRNLFQRGLQWFGSLLRPSSRNIARRYDFLLRAGHKRSLLVAESTVYRYMQSIESSKKWFADHQETILELYGRKHHLQREDLLLVIGTLDTRDYALFVNHYHPDGHAHFNVYAERQEGEPFGEWSTDAIPEPSGPHYEEENLSNSLSGHKVSMVRTNPEPTYSVLLARLRFKPDSTSPTSL